MTDLFPELAPKARTYQQTSREAWEAMVPINAELDRAIMNALAAAGAEGLICQAVETATRRTHQSVSGNLRHLTERGLVEFAEGYGKTDSGRRAMKWRVAHV